MDVGVVVANLRHVADGVEQGGIVFYGSSDDEITGGPSAVKYTPMQKVGQYYLSRLDAPKSDMKSGQTWEVITD